MKRVLICMMLMSSMMLMAKVDKKTVLFQVDLHCEGCINKIEKNIAFEKGVKDLSCDLKKKTVLVTYDAEKTNVETLQKAFEKIGKPAKVVTNAGANGEKAADATSGASVVH